MAPDALLIPVPLTTLLDKAEEQHAAAQSAGEFDKADRWARVRDALVDVIYESALNHDMPDFRLVEEAPE